MTSPNSVVASGLRSITLLLPLVFTPALFAQGGMGPDPYRPFNQQYDAFVYPVAPGTGDVLPTEAAMSRAGLSRGNQFQDYLRGNVYGNPGYPSQRRFDEKSQYRPNRKVDEESGFYEKQDRVSQAYFDYLREKDPRKRAELLKKYQQARLKPSREFRREARGELADGSTTSSGRSGRTSPPSRAGGSRGSAASGSNVPPPPRTGGSTGSSRTESSKPSDILEESLKRDREQGISSSPGRANPPPPTRNRSSGRIPPPPRRGGTSSPRAE